MATCDIEVKAFIAWYVVPALNIFRFINHTFYPLFNMYVIDEFSWGVTILKKYGVVITVAKNNEGKPNEI